MPLRSGGTPSTNAYLVADRDGTCTVVDPGIDSAANRSRIVAALSAIGSDLRRVRTIAITHLHPDHLDLGPWLAAASGGRLMMHALDLLDQQDGSAARRYDADADWGVPAHEAGRLAESRPPLRDRRTIPALPLVDGVLLMRGGPRMRVLHTPGHTRGHLCVVLPDDRLVLTGDHLLPDVHPGIGLGGSGPDNPIAAYLRSLERLAPYDRWQGAPGHGRLVADLAHRRIETRDHVLQRAREVALATAGLGTGASTWAIASRLSWSGGWGALSGVRLRSALRQTHSYRELVSGTEHAAPAGRQRSDVSPGPATPRGSTA